MALLPRFSDCRLPGFAAATIMAAALGAALHAQIPGRNVNMVSGAAWPDGDPYLQRQNEPSLAASSRNPLHLLGGSNDYRTVDLPGLPSGGETGDAWLGLYKSFDGGERWISTLVPGYPQDTSAAGQASPLYGYEAAADPVVRAGTSGLFYFAGLVFDRHEQGKSRIVVSRFIDNNNKEAGDPIHYLGASAVASNGGATGFLDKPWVAVDIPRPGAGTCSIQTPGPRGGTITQRIAAGNVYVAYTVIQGGGADITATIMFSRSTDCGVTWSAPVAISNAADEVNQGAAIAIDPVTGRVYVAWRKFGLDQGNDAIIITSAPPGGRFARPNTLREFYSGRDLGQLIRFLVGNRRNPKMPPKFEPAAPAAPEIAPFDQGTTLSSFRTNAYPSMAIDGTGRVYIAWAERGFRETGPQGDSSIVMTTGKSSSWRAPFVVDANPTPGHQLMPSIAFAGGTLMLVYYDLREDLSGVFAPWVDDAQIVIKRHTVDLRATQAPPADVPQFGSSVQVSRYVFGSRPGSREIEQLQFNPPNLPLFQLGSVPFMGDYVDVAPAPFFIQNTQGQWRYNTDPTTAPVFHTAWTDNRDVRPPSDGDWTRYTPPSGTATKSTFDPTQDVPQCEPGRAGMRNQNVYTARITAGLFAGSPGNTKPLDPYMPRGFVVFAQNATTFTKYFRFTIEAQPVGGRASFTQLASEPLVAVVDVPVPPLSTVSRTVFVTSTDPRARIPVDVSEIAGIGAPGPLPAGLSADVILNPDIANPDIANPDIANPDIANPDIANVEVYNPDIANPDIANPDIANPDIANPDIANPDIANVVIMNPDIANPDIANPDIANPDIANPDIANPDIANADIANGALTDVTWTVTNTGNTTASYDVTLFTSMPVPQGIKTQLIIHKTYKTPVSDGCTLKYETHTVLVANIINPDLATPDIANPDIANASLWLEPGGAGKITLRIVDPNPHDDITFDPLAGVVTPEIKAEGINSAEISLPGAEPPSATPPSTPTAALSIAAQPVNAEVGGSLGTVVVDVHTSDGGPATPLADVQVIASIVVNPGGGQLSGTKVVLTDATGRAQFTTLSIDRPGVGYRLAFSASSSNATPVASDPFTIGVPDVDPEQNVFLVTTAADSGPGSLRAAIVQANATPSAALPDVIAFAFRLPGVHTIALTSPLPAITQPVIIDGTTQAGYNVLTGQPLIQVSGAGIPGDGFVGLLIAAPRVTIRGLSLTGFGSASSQNTTPAIRVDESDATIEGNWIGIAPDLTAPGNQIGIHVRLGSAAIGGTGGMATRNVIGGGRTGILVTGGSGTTIRGNYIGLKPDGLTVAPNTVFGITLQTAAVTNTVIGGALPPQGYFSASWPGNVVAGNLGGGVVLLDTAGGGPVDTQILGNVIGLAVDGTPRGNRNAGVHVRGAPGTIIGAPGAGNVLSGNGEYGQQTSFAGRGIFVETGPSGPMSVQPVIQGNRIGTDPAGLAARPNIFEGIFLRERAVVGGVNPGEGNLIAGNGHAQTASGTGILLGAATGGAVIQGNRIGLSAAGQALGNGYSGITVHTTSDGGLPLGGVLIGGTTAGARNVISGNPHAGIAIYTEGTNPAPRDLVIKGNYIGTDPAGNVTGLGNGRFGILVLGGASDLTIGGPDLTHGNVIAGNGGLGVGAGIWVSDAASKRVDMRSNLLAANNGLGIDLGAPGVTPNDDGDADEGANNQQNFPIIHGVVTDGAGRLRVRLNSHPGVYTIQVFNNSSCDPSGHGEGQELLLDFALTAPAPGPVDVTMPTPLLAPGQILTATATDTAGNTSEFSACSPVTTADHVYYSDPSEGGNGHFYEYVNTPTASWNAASAAAEARSYLGLPGHLVTIGSAAENALVRDLHVRMQLNDMRAWVGLTDPAGQGQWQWITGEPLTYTNWADGEPNNTGSERWVEFFANGTWNNNVETFGAIQGFVVEYEPQFVVASVSDPAGDAATYSQTETSPDLVSATVLRRNDVLVFRIRYAAGTYDPLQTITTLMIDTDENPATGHPGITGGCSIDAENIGIEYLVSHRPGVQANLLQYAGTCNAFVFKAPVSVDVVAGGVDIILPLADLEDEGLLRFKVTTSVVIPPNASTGILDAMPNIGLPAGSTRSGS